jgi:type I restriction enzyme M protein
MRELVEHFSSLELSITNLPEDELGTGYEFLIKKFADDSGHTAAEFYTNRTVVHLMTEMLDVQPGEAVYDPTCGSGGMLMSCVAHLRKQGKEWRNVRLFGQERNLMTSSIARMNCFLHGIEDFRIERGDTLAEPKLVEGDKLMQFDVVLANPPYSIKQWDREAFRADPWGRNLFGVPPQGRADYAFQQHINKSLKARTGRCAVLWPHGVLFRQEEEEIRRKLIEADLIECVIGLGPNLFYNSPMEACILVCRTQKSKIRKGKVLFINAVNEVTRERAQSFLTEEHQSRILQAYQSDADIPGLSRHVAISEIRSKNGSLSIPLYFASTDIVQDEPAKTKSTLDATLSDFLKCSEALQSKLEKIISGLPQRSTVLNVKEEKPLSELIAARAGWTRVRFGDVVENCSDNGKGQGLAPGRYIGLEHIEPGSLHIRSFGDTSDGTTFTKKCKPGQVLFGKRRAYQRKVAVASFDALVSGDIYVLEPKTPTLLPEILPFICMSERFFEHAVGTSAGSLSPRTNWSSLANYEFELPPLNQQRRIAEILWALDVSKNQWVNTETAIASRRCAAICEFVADNSAQAQSLGELLEEVQYGISSKCTNQKRDGLNPVLRIPNVIGEKIDFTDLAWTDPTDDDSKYRLEIGDVLIVRTNGNPDYVGRTAVFEGSNYPKCLFASYLIRLKARKEELLPYFLHEMLASSSIKKAIRRQVKSSAGNYNLNTVGIRGLRIPVPSLEVQSKLLGELKGISDMQVMIRTLISRCNHISSLAINNLIG